jgi:prolipoprotein diacylglyceryltransferase
MAFDGYSILGLIGLIVAILVIYDVLANQKRMSVGMKVLWIVLAVPFSIITGIVYYFLVYKK